MNDRVKQIVKELIQNCDLLDKQGYKVSGGKYGVRHFWDVAMLRLFVYLGTRGKNLSPEESIFISEIWGWSYSRDDLVRIVKPSASRDV